MDYTYWSQMQQIQPPNPNSSTDPYAQIPLSTLNFCLPQSQNPNPSIDPANSHQTHHASTLVHPPGTDPFQSLAAYTLSQGYTYQTANGSSLVLSSAAYTQDISLLTANAAAADQLSASHYATSAVLPPSVIETLVPGSSDSKLWTYPISVPKKSTYWKKVPKKTKIVQSVWCEICNVECNAKDVLEQHKLGKKHLKNLEKLLGVSAPTTTTTGSASAASGSSSTTTSKNPIIGPPENPNKTKISTIVQKAKNPAVPPQNLEMKKRKVLNGGAPANAVRTCTLCNVVCNSDTVFRYHLVGQKHAAMVKKLTGG